MRVRSVCCSSGSSWLMASRWWRRSVGRASSSLARDRRRVVVVVMWCAGFESVTACDGPGGFDDEWATVFVEAGVGRVLLAFDADAAGDAGAVEAAARLGKLGVSCARVELPKGMDVNDVVVRAKQPADALGRLLRHAVWIDSTPPARPPQRAQPDPPPSLPVDAPPADPSPPSHRRQRRRMGRCCRWRWLMASCRSGSVIGGGGCAVWGGCRRSRC